MRSNLYDEFYDRFPSDMRSTFIENENGSIYSYSQLHRSSSQLANLLVQLGLKKGDRVAAQVDKSAQAVFLYLACIRAGLAFVPLNTAYKEHELEYFFEDAEPGLVVVGTRYYEAVERIATQAGVKNLETLDSTGGGSLIEKATGQSVKFETVTCKADDTAAILYTSGTTGKPKGAMITHRNLFSNARTLHKLWGWQSADVLLHALPIFHIHGLFVACNCVLMNGSSILFISRFDCDKVIDLLPRSTVMMGVPTFYTRLLSENRFNASICSNMRLFISGSAPLLEQTFEEFKQRTGHVILERYGMTEAGMITSNPLNGERISGTVGLPLPGTEVRLVDEYGHVLPNGREGRLEVKGDNVFLGYWRMPEKTAKDLTADGFLKTGDIAVINDQGYVSIVGRTKDLVISGGYNVYPKEVELCIDKLDQVLESAVIGLPDPDYGEAVTAVVVLHPKGAELTEDRLIEHVKYTLAGYKVPKRVYFIDALPRNAMGKVQKNILRENFSF
ncbi:malonate--CoA ligase [Marinobacterium rhizophilum]|uniref:Malonyl-CoA synthase n=1 Tax=Marinobacterium rhizophilum TaxID=420402 RepID=A0ABY5HM25_9GAMM|nr:malonyl-CoA synthase [Marinobacterium rhizophilum]UTW11961.1 malonyl-CoA synthase [Marinobacterium rhizophilum]